MWPFGVTTLASLPSASYVKINFLPLGSRRLSVYTKETRQGKFDTAVSDGVGDRPDDRRSCTHIGPCPRHRCLALLGDLESLDNQSRIERGVWVNILDKLNETTENNMEDM